MDTKQLYKISKYVQNEAMYCAEIQNSGTNQDRIIEKLDKNADYMKTMSFLVKFMVSFYIILSVVTPILNFREMQLALDLGVDPSKVLFIGSLILSLYFLIQSITLIMFNLFFSSGIVSKDSFRYLTHLPLSQEEIQKILLFAYFRGMNWPIIISIISLPLGTALVTHSLVYTLIAIGISLVNLFFTFLVLIFLGIKLRDILDLENKKSSIYRVIIMVCLVVVVVSALLGSQFLIPEVSKIYYRTFSLNFENFNRYLPLIPFPFNGAYLQLLPFSADQGLTIDSTYYLLGLILFLAFLKRFYQSIKHQLFNITRSSLKGINSKENSEDNLRPDKKGQTIATRESVHCEFVEPNKAFFKKDVSMVKGDIKIISWFMISFLYAIMSSIMARDEEFSSIPFTYGMVGAYFVIMGVLRIDNAGSTIMSSIPALERDKATAKVRWLYIILPMAFIPSQFLVLNTEYFMAKLIRVILWLPLCISIAILIMEFQVFMFGKMKTRFVLEEVKSENKILKYTGMAIFGIFMLILFGALTAIAWSKGGMRNYVITLLIMDIIVGGIGYFIFNKMFPKIS